jgi:hypothetical protein
MKWSEVIFLSDSRLVDQSAFPDRLQSELDVTSASSRSEHTIGRPADADRHTSQQQIIKFGSDYIPATKEGKDQQFFI